MEGGTPHAALVKSAQSSKKLVSPLNESDLIAATKMSVPRPLIHSLGISKAFNSLSLKEKHYAHHMARYVFARGTEKRG